MAKKWFANPSMDNPSQWVVSAQDENGEQYLIAESVTEDEARLIAAAPILFETLKAYQNANRLRYKADYKLYDQGKLAIAKAGEGSLSSYRRGC